MCKSCYKDHYTSCNDCDCIIHRENAHYTSSGDPYCSSCYHDCDLNTIKSYDYRPVPIFYGEGNRYMGVEIEIDCGGESDSNARSILNVAEEDTIYIKHDGSLDNGMEIVSHPMSLDYHINEMNWLDVMNKALELKYYSHKAFTCGLHVHVSRSSFGETSEEQDEVIGKILYFVEKHWDYLLKFSRRTQEQLDRWASRYGLESKAEDILLKAKNGQRGRYACVNLANYYTIEFRIFRGTLKYNTFIATLQLVNRICDVAFSMSENEIKEQTWDDFANEITENELITYLKERKIYINKEN